MADISGNCGGHRSYFPTIPPLVPKAAMSYCQSVMVAPYTALAGVVVDGRQPSQHPVTSSCRVRKQVGFTNRWRLPQSLGSDLLGTAQAAKALHVPYNKSMVRIITAENPKSTVNVNSSEEYSFRVNSARQKPHTADVAAHTSHGSSKPPKKYQTTQPVDNKGQTRVQSNLARLNTFRPPTARMSKPMDIFQYHSKRGQTMTGPDVLLQSLGMNWELHRPFLQKSPVLSDMLSDADHPQARRYYKNKISETLDEYISKSSFYSNEYQELSRRLNTVEKDDVTTDGIEHPKHVSEQRVSSMTVIRLDIKDPTVTPHAMAVCLGNLYHETPEVEPQDVVAVVAAAHAIRFSQLKLGCADIMLKNINSSTVCIFHRAAVKYDLENVELACERWLELNLVSQMQLEIQLRQLPMDLLQKVLKSNRLFTFNEFSLYRVLAYWVFLRMNAKVQLMPAYSSILMYFNSLPKGSALIEREEGECFTPLFMSLRLHGITETSHMQDVQAMNIIPQSWIVKILTQHYYALQNGGDMSLLNNFETGAIRQGFIVDGEPHYHSEVMSLHGFHFELKAARTEKSSTYKFYIQRLKPNDPILSFRHSERHTFSMRPDRDARYNIQVQFFDDDRQCQYFSLGVQHRRFGLGSETSKSEVLTIDNVRTPLYVTCSIVFPPS